MQRREFLRLSGFFTISAAGGGLLSACGSSDSSTPASGVYTFPQGVASGDPRDASIVFWTRSVPTSGASTDVPLRLEVSTQSSFETLVASAELTALAKYDHTVRHKVTGLSPYTLYHYRFVAGGDISATGKARTAPKSGALGMPSTLKFGYFTCQDWVVNHWQAMSLMAEENFDFLIHLGDYIYETVGQAFQTGAAEPAHTALTLPNGTTLASGGKYATSLADYRYLYRTYRTDQRLQTLHQSAAAIIIWDDHEFSDDAWKDRQTYTNANAQETDRRRYANQAWAEYMPIDWSDVAFTPDATTGFETIKIYRNFAFGDLMDLIMTDQRLYRDDHVMNEALVAQQTGANPVTGDSSIGARYFVSRANLLAVESMVTATQGRIPSILGPTQTQWWKDKMKQSSATWKVWGNEVTTNRMWLDFRAMPGISAPFNDLFVLNADVWDGYPAHKKELLGYLKSENIQNVVALTGDLHAFQAGIVVDDPDASAPTPVLADFVTAGISSGSFYSYIKAGAQGTPLAALVASQATFDGLLMANNPGFAYVDHDAQGYASVTVSASEMAVTFVKVKGLNTDGSAPSSALAKKTQITLAAGSKTLVVQDNLA